MEGNFSQCMSTHHNVYFKYLTILCVNYASNLKSKKRTSKYHILEVQQPHCFKESVTTFTDFAVADSAKAALRKESA